MTLERHNPDGMTRPSGFTHAVTATGSRLVLLAGQQAVDGEGRLTAGGITAQFELALHNLLSALRAAGGGPADLARLTVYTTDVSAYRAQARQLGRIWRAAAGRDYPAVTVVGVVQLWNPGALIELDGLAVLP